MIFRQCKRFCGRFFGVEAWIIALLLSLFLLGGQVIQTAGARPAVQASDSPTSTDTPTPTATSTPTTPPPAHSLYFPLTVKNLDPFALTAVWTAGNDGVARSVFFPGEAIRYYSQGKNYSGDAAVVGMTWSHSGACGNATIYKNNQSLPSGLWENFQTGITPTCLGIYTLKLDIAFQGKIFTQSTSIVINSSLQAFDKCNVASVAEMQTWWSHSPYKAANIYIGGISRGCANKELTASWINGVGSQGWFLIPTWVGPQAPCSGFSYKMSSNANTAYQEGRQEASAAAQAASKLGLITNNVIYYDVEGYSGDTQCRNAVKSFIRGWTERLHELNIRSGVYGSPCKSYIQDWSTIKPKPDDVWIAHWTNTQYNPYATVWNAPCLDNNLWTDHQRTKQYAGQHKETWGGLTFTIDSNVVDSAVIAPPYNAMVAAAQMGPPAADEEQAAPILSMQQVSPGQGWVLAGGRLLWKGGQAAGWRNMTPPGARAVLAAFFVDPQHGWVVLPAGEEGRLAILKTVDGGASWQTSLLEAVDPAWDPPLEAAHLTFVDAHTGWLSLTLQSSSNFNLGKLFKTSDGGKTWQPQAAPAGGAVHFTDAQRGRTQADPGQPWYATQDGGMTWQLQAGPPPEEPLPPALVNVPVGMIEADFSTPAAGWVQVQESQCSADKLRCQIRTRLLQTQDEGKTWVEITP